MKKKRLKEAGPDVGLQGKWERRREALRDDGSGLLRGNRELPK